MLPYRAFWLVCRWVIDPPLEIVVPAKRTPWPDAPPDLPYQRIANEGGHVEKHVSKKVRSSRSKRSSRNKKKHETHVDTQVSEMSSAQEK